METTIRVFRNTFKQIRRSGWLALASVSVMVLAFLIGTIFGVLGYTINLFLTSIEQEPQIYAFFEIGTDEDEIFRLQQKWESLDEVAYIDYTSEEQAKQEFYEAQKDVNDLAAKAVEDRQLPASLAIRLSNLNKADEISEIIASEKEVNSNLKLVLYSSNIVDNIREVFFWVRLGGGVVMAVLFVVIILFTFLTMEFKMHSRADEIGIMQLVGGSLWFIRMPFIIEGMVYGAIGAIVSNIILFSIYTIAKIETSKGDYSYVQDLLSRFNWPQFDTLEVIFIVLILVLIGAILGGMNSYLAIRRYIR